MAAEAQSTEPTAADLGPASMIGAWLDDIGTQLGDALGLNGSDDAAADTSPGASSSSPGADPHVAPAEEAPSWWTAPWESKPEASSSCGPEVVDVGSVPGAEEIRAMSEYGAVLGVCGGP